MFKFHDLRSIHSRVIVFAGRKTYTKTHRHAGALYSLVQQILVTCVYIMTKLKKSDVQIFRICGHTTRLTEIQLIRLSENWLQSDMADSPEFFSSEIRCDRFADFCFHTSRFPGNFSTMSKAPQTR